MTRALLTIFAAILFALGWLFGKTHVGLVWAGKAVKRSWVGTAVTIGWTDAHRKRSREPNKT